jgi:hypothetical protein
VQSGKFYIFFCHYRAFLEEATAYEGHKNKIINLKSSYKFPFS